ALLGSVTVFDFGFSQASTKFVAEHLARNDRMGAARVLWTALPINVALGLPCAVGLAAAAPALATRVFHVPAGAQQDVIAALVLVAIALPFVLVQGMLRGVPSALQRFDLINTISMAAATVQWTSAVAFAYLGGGVRSVIAATVVVRIAGTLVYGVLAVRLLPETAARGAWSLSGVRRLASFSSWIAVSQLLTPVLMYAD